MKNGLSRPGESDIIRIPNRICFRYKNKYVKTFLERNHAKA